MSETKGSPEKLLEDPRDRFYKFAEGLFGSLDPKQLDMRLLASEVERKTRLILGKERTVEMVEVFAEPQTDTPEGERGDLYSAFLSTIQPDGSVDRQDFTIDASAYRRKFAGEEVDANDLMLMTRDSARSIGHELEEEAKLAVLVEEMQQAPPEAWHPIPPEQRAA